MKRINSLGRFTEKTVSARAERTGRHLKRHGLMVATAESCTGGWIAKMFTDIAGSSDWFAAGAVTYSNNSKTDLLGVPARTLERFGAVSEQTAIAMAIGALRRLRVDVAVSATGVAGPGGGSLEKPVGTVWLAWASRVQGRVQVNARLYRFRGGRNLVRLQAVSAALQGLIRL